MSNISIVIPAFNEEETIGEVIDIVNINNKNNEIIVVNNCSTDNTEQIAKQRGARVVSCNDKGKGNAMKAGLFAATNEIVVFLDADVLNYNEDIIKLLTDPIINDDIDFVKSTFDRESGGLVTEIAVKPLLDILFPNLYKFSEPISGMIASKKSLLEKTDFESDYGVDIGILLDMAKMNAKIKEVNIGSIINMSHKAKNNQVMRNMSIQIMKSIIKRTNIK